MTSGLETRSGLFEQRRRRRICPVREREEYLRSEKEREKGERERDRDREA